MGDINILNIIHLSKRIDRLILLTDELKEQKISRYVLWEGEEVIKSRRTGVTRSHKRIVQDAKNKNLDYVLIAEDDIRFFGVGAWKFYLKNTPKKFDIYFGMVYVGDFDNKNRIHSVCSGFTLYCVHKRFYDVFLSVPDDCHIDQTITSFHKTHLMIVCNPFVCEQNGTFSDNL